MKKANSKDKLALYRCFINCFVKTYNFPENEKVNDGR
jgi:hypothetical protein